MFSLLGKEKKPKVVYAGFHTEMQKDSCHAKTFPIKKRERLCFLLFNFLCGDFSKYLNEFISSKKKGKGSTRNAKIYFMWLGAKKKQRVVFASLNTRTQIVVDSCHSKIFSTKRQRMEPGFTFWRTKS